eukprot:scaffold5169_cov172-Amphora_coffeaeformis.AAC.1
MSFSSKNNLPPEQHKVGEEIIGGSDYQDMSPRIPPPPMTVWNGALRFGLEASSLVGLGHFGWAALVADPAWVKPIVGVAMPLVAAAAWGTWNVPNDPSRGGGAPVPVSGTTRLCVEVVVLGCGGASLFFWNPVAGCVFSVGTVIHYSFYHTRIQWLLQQDGR